MKRGRSHFTGPFFWYAGHDSEAVGWKSHVAGAERAESRARSNRGASPRGKEAGGKTTDTIHKNQIKGRDRLGKGAMDSEVRNSWGSRRGKFGLACGEVLSLIPGGPEVCQQWRHCCRSLAPMGTFS
jgi:hypothetical protein